MPRKATVLDVKNKLATIIGLKDYIKSLSFSGALFHKPDSELAERVLVNAKSLSKSMRIYAILITVHESMLSDLKLPKELALSHPSCDRGSRYIDSSPQNYPTFRETLLIWNSTPEDLKEMHRKNVNFLILQSAIQDSIWHQTSNIWRHGLIADVRNGFNDRLGHFGAPNPLRFHPGLLILNLLTMLTMSTGFVTNVYGHGAAYALMATLILMVSLTCLFVSLINQYTTVVEYYMRHRPVADPPVEILRPYVVVVSNVLQAVCEFFFTLFPMVL